MSNIKVVHFMECNYVFFNEAGNIAFKSEENSVFVLGNGNEKLVGLMENNKEVLFSMTKESEEDKLIAINYSAENWSMHDKINIENDGVFKVTRQYINNSTLPREAVFIFEGHTTFKPDFFLIPCVSYNGNEWGKGKEPKGLECEGLPWIFSYDRMGLPSATFSENGEHCVGVFVSDADSNSLVSSCSMQKKSGAMVHRLYWPNIEGPKVYSGRNRYSEAIYKTITVQPMEIHEVTFYVCISKVETLNNGWTKIYDYAFDMLKKSKFDEVDKVQLWASQIEFAKNLVKTIEDKTLINIGYHPNEDDNGWHCRQEGQFEIGWCGQNATFATSFIYDYLVNKNEKSLNLGIEILDTWEKYARMDNGLFYGQFDYILDGQKDATVDTCNLSWGAYQYMNAFELLKKVNIDRANWLEMGLKLCDFFVEKYDKTYGFGKSWDLHTGNCVDTGGTIGCFVVMPMVKAYEITKDEKYLNCAKSAYELYVKRDLDNMVCTAGALDTSCVDKETCWPLLKCGLDLYEITKEEFYIESAKKAGYYILSWMYHYDVIYSKDTDFSKYNYKTYGATAVSTQHHHLDPWGALLSKDFIKLGKLTKDTRWEERGAAMWGNSLIGVSDGSFKVHERIRPIGSQNEAYFHCNWFFDGKYGGNRGSFNDWLVTWPAAFRLIALMDEVL